MIIGIDFDNTIACYDHVFSHVASETGLLERGVFFTKSEVKEQILRQNEGDLLWQKLQGKIYGKYMHLASIFPGFVEFLHLSKIRDCRLYLVSHKTEFGHFDEEKIPLRDAALSWLGDNGLIDGTLYSFNENEIYFESTRESKIKRIQEIQCDYYIDDLSEVLTDTLFPESTEKILFNSLAEDLPKSIKSIKSWRQITQYIHKGWDEAEISSTIDHFFTGLETKQAKLVNGRGNSRIYQLTNMNDACYALKIYPDIHLDTRPRLDVEYAASDFLTKSKLPVACPIAKDTKLNWAIYDWVSGSPITEPDKYFIDEAVQFVKLLINKSRHSITGTDFSLASEACLCGKDIVGQIKSRLLLFEKTDSVELNHYLNNEFIPSVEKISQSSSMQTGELFELVLDKRLQILSPSDFGSHNTVMKETGETVFIDFEYFGWDDPVKLVSDFYWHPGMNLSLELKQYWLNSIKSVFIKDEAFAKRLNAYLPLYALRWCLIVLNEFLPDRLAKRLHASNQNEIDNDILLSNQLKKSKNLLHQVIKDLPNHGPTFQTS